MTTKIEMYEMYLGRSTPTLFKDKSFPLKDEIKSYGRVLRVEPDGTIFSYTSPDSLNVYLVIEYGQLYLKWAFSGDKDGMRFYEYNMKFPYTGTFNGLEFREGNLVETRKKYDKKCFEGQTYTPIRKEEFNDEIIETFVLEFCAFLREKYNELKNYHDELSSLFYKHIPEENNNLLKDEVIRERIHKYMYHSRLLYCNEYEIIRKAMLHFSQVWFESIYPASKDMGLYFTDCFESYQWHYVEMHMRNAFDRKTLANLIRRCLEENDSKTLARELKEEFLEIMAMIPGKIEIKLSPRVLPCRVRSKRKRLREYLDD